MLRRELVEPPQAELALQRRVTIPAVKAGYRQRVGAHWTFANYWIHNGFVNINQEKMSKSLQNFRTVRDLLQSYRGEVLRFALLSAHYRSPMNFSAELLEQGAAEDGLVDAVGDSDREKERKAQFEAAVLL